MKSMLIPALLSLVCLPEGPSSIQWQGNWEEAFQRALTEKKLIFLAVNMDGERANDRLAKSVYHEEQIVALANQAICLVASASDHPGATQCPRFGSLPCTDHRRIDASARESVLKADAEGFVIAPQHVFLDGAGKVLLSVPYEISAAELEWCLASALKLVDPAFQWNLSSSARSPRRLVQGGVFDPSGAGGGTRIPTREETLALIAELKKGQPAGGRMSTLRSILTADEPEARDFIQSELRRGGGKGGGADIRAELLHAIGARSPASYWELVADFLDDGSPILRAEACVAMEQLGAAGAVKELSSLLAKEKDPLVQKDLVRALAACGAEDAKVRDKVLKLAAKEKDPLLRLNAIVSLGHFPPEDPEVRDLLGTKLSQGLPDEQIAAACAAAFSRDPSWLPEIERAAGLEGSPQRKEALAAATEVLRDGKLAVLQAPLERVTQDKIHRERFFGLVMD